MPAQPQHASVTIASNLLKKHYDKELNLLNPEQYFPAWNEIEQKTPTVTGKGGGWNIAAKGKFGGGAGPYTELGDLPDPYFKTNATGEILPKNLASAFSITGDLMDKADSQASAFAEGLVQVMSECEEKLTRLQAFALWSDGTLCEGKILTVTPGGGNTEVVLNTTTLDAPTLALYANDDDELEAFSTKSGVGTYYTNVGRIIDGGVADNLAKITVAGDMTAGGVGEAWAADQYLFLKGARSTTSPATFNVPNGIPNVVADSGEMILKTTDYAWWKSKRINLGGETAPSRKMIHKIFRMMSFRNNRRYPTHFFFNQCHAEDLVELYWGLLQEARTSGSQSVKPGHGDFEDWKIPGGRGVKMMDDDYCPPGSFYFPNIKELRINWLRKPSFIDDKEDGLRAMRMENKEIWKGYVRCKYNFFSPMRAAHGYINNSVKYDVGGLWA